MYVTLRRYTAAPT